MLLAVQDSALISEEVGRFVKDYIHEGTEDLIVKPTHLSNAEGVTTISGVKADEKPKSVEFLESHLETYMNKKAQEFESEALQSLRPGFVVQPKYKSNVGFHIPLELRIVTLWGKARMGIWWWGVPYSGTPFQRNTWIVRRPTQKGELGDDDQWDVAHEHPGNNPGFSKALELFLKFMPQMAKTAEQLATAVGAPFLRTDFFVGDPKWGVRLNEVAYGSGCLHCRHSNKGDTHLVDDAHAMAQILREGITECKKKLPAQRFLAELGVEGSKYEDLIVNKVLGSEVQQASGMDDELEIEEQSVPAELCVTPRLQCLPQGFAACVQHAEGAVSGNLSTDSQNRIAISQDHAAVNRVRVSATRPPSPTTPEAGFTELLKKVEKVRESEDGIKGKGQWSVLSWLGFQTASQKRLPRQGFCRPQECRKSEFIIRQESWQGGLDDDLL
jgi:hypothetical protein